MKRFQLTFFLFIRTVTTASAQAGAHGVKVVVSPEVAKDGRVRFRLPAVKASLVTVSGDFGLGAGRILCLMAPRLFQIH